MLVGLWPAITLRQSPPSPLPRLRQPWLRTSAASGLVLATQRLDSITGRDTRLPRMKYVVTGAAGFIGSHLAEALSAGGHDVLGVDSFTDYYDPALKEENAAAIDVARIDLAEDDLDLDGVDGVFHFAGQPGVRSFGDVFDDYVRRNLLASRRVFEVAAATGVRVVFASSSSVYGEAERYPTPEDGVPSPISPYGITKLGCEQL